MSIMDQEAKPVVKLSIKETVPSNWDIKLKDPENDEIIFAVCTEGGRTFEGTRAEFCAFLRGE